MVPSITLTTGSLPRQMSHFAGQVGGEEDVPGSKVSMDKGLVAEVAHAASNIPTELQQQIEQALRRALPIGMTVDEIAVEE